MREGSTGNVGNPSASERTGSVEALRAAIDAGDTGEKVAHADPAAAPLGADAEAAGTPTLAVPIPPPVARPPRHLVWLNWAVMGLAPGWLLGVLIVIAMVG